MTGSESANPSDQESDADSSAFQPRRARVLSITDDDDDNVVKECPISELFPNGDPPVEDKAGPAETTPKSSSKFGFKSNLITDSDVEYDNESDHNDWEPAALNVNACPDSNYEDSNANGVRVDDKPLRVKGTRKKNSKKGLDDKLAIRSETQRLEREKTVHLPYHRPKQRSLREFLSRKKNQLNETSLRLSSPSMIHTWEEIDKSIKEAPEFFKSESEDELEFEPEAEAEPIDQCEGNIAEVQDKELETAVIDGKIEGAPEEVVAYSQEYPAANVEPVDNDKDNIEQDMDQPEVQVQVPSMSRTEKATQWLDDIVNYEKREALKSKLQLSPTILNKVPTLSNDFDDFVDLVEKPPETTELKPGVRQLMARLFKGLDGNTHAGPQYLTTTFTEKDEFGNIKNIGVETIPLTTANVIVLENEKPAVKRQLLKNKLRNEIEAKWEKQYKERSAQESTKEGFETGLSEKSDASDCEMEAIIDDDGSSTETETESEEDVAAVIEKPRRFCAFGDSEAEESNSEDDGCDGDDETEEDDDEENNREELPNPPKRTAQNDDDELDCSILPAFQPGGGYSLGGSDLTQQSQPLPIKPPSPISSPANLSQSLYRVGEGTPQQNNQVPCDAVTDVSSVKKNLFGSETSLPTCAETENNADDPFLFVSGDFPTTVRTEEKEAALVSQSQTQLKRIILLEESEDSRESSHTVVADDDDVSGTLKENADLHDDDFNMTLKKKNKQLVFSDDEQDDAPEESAHENDEDADSVAEPDPGLDDINYDSEENEVRPGEFFDKEAELSESEWSGDEDERGLDTFEPEAGDADVFDESQVASQLERIHMQKMLDEDKRDVRRIQELIFEDGDLYAEGGPRQRNFRWKNTGNFDWSSVYKCDDVTDGDASDMSDRAKLRFEKNLFLLKAQQEGKLDELEESSQDKKSVLGLGRQMLQRPKAQLGPTVVNPKNQKMLPRGSFLSKDKNFLSRIARTTASGSEAPLLGASHSKNFAFSVQDKTEETATDYVQGSKRKAVGYEESVKRTKLACRNSVLDQLLPTEATLI